MKPKSDLSRQLYELMLQRGYEENFCDIVTKNLNTDFTASRMIGLQSSPQQEGGRNDWLSLSLRPPSC